MCPLGMPANTLCPDQRFAGTRLIAGHKQARSYRWIHLQFFGSVTRRIQVTYDHCSRRLMVSIIALVEQPSS